MKIVEISKNELNLVKDLAYKIWPTAYAEILSELQLNFMLESFYSVEALEAQINKGQVFLVAEENGNYLGFAAYELNINNSNKTKLHKIYVLPATQGTGLGKQLLEEVTKRAKNAQNTHLYLNVNKYNKAQKFYEKLGFKIISEEVISIGNGYVMDDYVMEKVI